MKIVTGRRMAEIDRITINELNIPGAVLMENAARAVCRVFAQAAGPDKRPRVLVLCGSGNNGGDGFCVSRILKGWGYPVKVIHIGKPESLKGDALLNYTAAKNYAVDITSISQEEEIDFLYQELSKNEWIIDAVFGTGLTKQVAGIAASVLEIASYSGKKCIAVDIPSGINSDNAQILSKVIKAEITITFGLPKWGHFIYPAADLCGQLVVADIGFPVWLLKENGTGAEITAWEDIANVLHHKPANANKGTFGKFSVAGGNSHLLGAATIAGQAALKSGCGYVKLFIPKSLEPAAKIIAPELVTYGLKDDGGSISGNAVDEFLSESEGSTAVALGPGIGKTLQTAEFVEKMLEKCSVPVVIDADALNIIAQKDNISNKKNISWILTPHLAEAARLLNIDIKDVLADPPGSAAALVEKYNAVVVLKGANTIIASDNGNMLVNITGNPALSVIGSGDVLTGIIGALLARGIPAFEAAAYGVYVHGLAADIASVKLYQDGLIPSELLRFIPEAIEKIRTGEITEKIIVLR